MQTVGGEDKWGGAEGGVDFCEGRRMIEAGEKIHRGGGRLGGRPAVERRGTEGGIQPGG